MDIEKELAAMQERMFSRELLGVILEASAREREQDGRDYSDPKALSGVHLSTEQSAMLSQAKALFLEKLRRSMRFAFSRGCYAVFQQYFAKNPPEDPFQVYIENYLPEDHGRENADWEASDAIIKALKEALPDKEKARLLAIETVWESRYSGVLRHSFILGCRYALSLIESIGRAGASLSGRIRRIEQNLKFDGIE